MSNSRGLRIFFIIVFVLCVTAAFFVGVRFGYGNRPAVEKVSVLLNKENDKPGNVDFSPFWKAWSILNEKYVIDHSTSSPKITDQDKVWGAVSGLVNSLGDPYTVFLPPEKKKRFEDDISGNFSGVGMEVGIKDGIVTVIAPLPDSPAKKAGILAGDKILKIDDTITSDMSTDEAVSLIRGEKGKPVKFILAREKVDKPIDITVIRDTITIPTLDTKTLDNGIFVIKLYNFSAPSADLFRQALRDFINAKTDKLIIDLRGNPGGFLEAATDMASWFLPKDKPIVIEKHGDGGEDKVYKSRGYDVFTDKLKMVILVDRGSASASEILAGALSEYKIATLVGETTFGKGSVQELVPLTSDSSIKITIAKWYTPLGKSISKSGITPEIEIPFTEEAFKAGTDPQQEAAVKILLGEKVASQPAVKK